MVARRRRPDLADRAGGGGLPWRIEDFGERETLGRYHVGIVFSIDFAYPRRVAIWCSIHGPHGPNTYILQQELFPKHSATKIYKPRVR
jgi:hypothetical protein